MPFLLIAFCEMWGMDISMGKSKTTKSDGVKAFANTQDLGNQKRISRGAGKQNVSNSQPK